MNSHNTIPDSLLISYLNDNATVAEQKMIEVWLKDESNKKYFEQLKAIWTLTAIEKPCNADPEAAWNNLKNKVAKQPAKTILLQSKYLARIAALLLLCISIYAGRKFLVKKDTTPIALQESKPAQIAKETFISSHQNENIPTENIRSAETIKNEVPVEKNNKQSQHNTSLALAAAHSREEICNNTMCPLEICIIQTLQCEDKQSTFAHCSLLQPDQSGLLHYKTFEEDAIQCNAPVQEIRIKRVSTGETIVLNANTNVTAQEFFDYITGDKKGDIVAGIFETDCNNRCADQSIILDNTLGIPVILQ